MGAGWGCFFGEILEVVHLLEDDKVRAALESDLIRLGARLRWVGDGTDRLNWRDVIVLVQHPPADGAMSREVSDGDSLWGLQEQLLAGVYDAMQGMLWQNGGGKGTRPKPLPRPGVSGGHDSAPSQSSRPEPQGNPFKTYGSGVFKGETTSIAELNEWLGWQVTSEKD